MVEEETFYSLSTLCHDQNPLRSRRQKTWTKKISAPWPPNEGATQTDADHGTDAVHGTDAGRDTDPGHRTYTGHGTREHIWSLSPNWSAL